MRVVIWARAEVAIPLALALRSGLLIGGIDETDANDMIRRFENDPNGIMVCTAAYEGKWTAEVEAMTVFTEDSWVQNPAWASFAVADPKDPPPTSEDFLKWYRASRGTEAPKQLTAQPKALPAPELKVRKRRKKEPKPC
jgi:hypothetical protein